MSLLAGGSTALGAGAVVAMPLPAHKVPPGQMAFILAFAGGVMLSTSAMEFWVPALVAGGGAELGRIILFSALGAIAYLLLSWLVAEPDMTEDHLKGVTGMHGSEEAARRQHEMVEAPSGSPTGQHAAVLSKSGATLMQKDELHDGLGSVAHRWRLAIVLMLSLTAHNFPEGMAVAISALDNERLGLVVMLAIAIHNIPEGIAISVSVLGATNSRAKAFWMALLSGMAEPLGAAVALFLATSAGAPSEDTMSNLLCAVGGVMSAVSIKELLPEAWKLCSPRACLAGFFAGFLVMLVTIRYGA